MLIVNHPIRYQERLCESTVLNRRYIAQTTNSVMSERVRNSTHSPVIGLNRLNVEFDESWVPKTSDDDQAESIAYATRAPRMGWANVMPARSYDTSQRKPERNLYEHVRFDGNS